ncbi:MAG: hypothetical protein ACKOW3_04790 [Hyphomicrobium sp.]
MKKTSAFSNRYAVKGGIVPTYTLYYSNYCRFALLSSLVTLLSGCGLGSLSGSLGSVLPGGSSSSAPQTSSLTEEQLLSAAQAGGNNPIVAGMEVSPGCPRFLPAARDNFLTIYETGRPGDGLAIMHRGEITKTARECSLQPGFVTVKFGFAGRILLGPKGKPGVLTFPVTVVVTDEKRTRVTSVKLSVTAAVTIEKPIGYFSTVDSVSFKIPEGSRAGDYQVSVAFDRNVPGAG